MKKYEQIQAAEQYLASKKWNLENLQYVRYADRKGYRCCLCGNKHNYIHPYSGVPEARFCCVRTPPYLEVPAEKALTALRDYNMYWHEVAHYIANSILINDPSRNARDHDQEVRITGIDPELSTEEAIKIYRVYREKHGLSKYENKVREVYKELIRLQ